MADSKKNPTTMPGQSVDGESYASTVTAIKGQFASIVDRQMSEAGIKRQQKTS